MAIIRNIQEKKSINWDNIISRMVNEDYALMIGPEAILEGATLSQWENECIEQLKEKGHNGQLIKAYSEGLVEVAVNEISRNIRNLLATKCFKVVLTTVYHPFLEKVFDEVWGRDENGIPKYDICSYEARDDRFNDMASSPGFIDSGDFKPVLVYLLGNVSDVRSYENKPAYIEWRKERESLKIVKSERELMEAISSWLSRMKQTKLHTLLSKRKLLALGGKYDDWAFRFLLYALKGFDYETEDELESISDLSIPLNKEYPSDIKLESYLEKNKLHITESDIRQFIDHILERYEQYTEREAEKARQKDYESTYDAFLSYASEDKTLANRLYRSLSLRGLRVWMDYPLEEHPNIEAAERYKKVIEGAIRNSAVFIPLISENTKEALARDNKNPNKNEHRFFHRVEWAMAQKLGKPIIPVAAGIMARNEIEKVGWKLIAPKFWPDEATREDKEVQMHILSDGVALLSSKILNLKNGR